MNKSIVSHSFHFVTNSCVSQQGKLSWFPMQNTLLSLIVILLLLPLEVGCRQHWLLPSPTVHGRKLKKAYPEYFLTKCNGGKCNRSTPQMQSNLIFYLNSKASRFSHNVPLFQIWSQGSAYVWQMDRKAESSKTDLQAVLK